MKDDQWKSSQPARCYLPTLLELKTQHLPSSLLIEFSILVWPTHLLCFFPFVTIIGHHFFFNSPQQRGSLKRTEIFQVSIAKKWFSDNRNRSGKNKWFNVFRYLPISYPLFHIMSLMNQSWDIHWKSMNSLCHAYPWCIHKCTCKEFKFLIWIKIQCNMYNIGCAVPESKKKECKYIQSTSLMQFQSSV